MMKKMLFLMLFLLILGAANLSAQVRIGGDSKPVSVSVLDLNPDSVNNNATKGLALPRVALAGKTLPDPMSKHQEGLLVYNTTASGDLKRGIYYNHGTGWSFLQPDTLIVPDDYEPVIFLRQPGFAYLGTDGSYTDTLFVELAMNDKSNVKYQWYRRMEDGTSVAITGATKDSLFISKGQYGINQSDYIYRLFCVALNGYEYGVSSIGGAVYGVGARLTNGKWLKFKSFNLGATEMSIADMMAYVPSAATSGVGDANYDPTVYGDWYQWGRKKDGHEKRGILGANTFIDSLNTPNGLATSALDANGQVLPSSDAYGLFIGRTSGTTLDWRQYPENASNSQTAPATTWTWGNPTDGITPNDPCRTAFPGTNGRVPTLAEWSQVLGQNYNIWVTGKTSGVLIMPGGSADKAYTPASLFIPASGVRNQNTTQWATGNGLWVWSSTSESTGGARISLTDGKLVTGSSPRAAGASVRCVTD